MAGTIGSIGGRSRGADEADGVLSIILTSEVAGRECICEFCDDVFRSTNDQPRAWIDDEYVGMVCHACATADPDRLQWRIQRPLSEAQNRARQLESVAAWLRTVTPAERRRSFRLLGGADCSAECSNPRPIRPLGSQPYPTKGSETPA